MKSWPLVAVLAVASTAIFMLASRNAQADPVPSSPVQDPPPVVHTWTPTEGPTPGDYPFGPNGTNAPGWLMCGDITPPLASSVTATITGVTCIDPSSTVIDPGNCAGGSASGATFCFWIKSSCMANCKKVKVTFTDDSPEQNQACVFLAKPTIGTTATLDPTITGIGQGADLQVTVMVLGRNGQLNTSFDGDVTVIPGSVQGSGVLIDGAAGATTVSIVEGYGTMSVRTVNGIAGDTLTFDIIAGGRLALRRSSLNVW